MQAAMGFINIRNRAALSKSSPVVPVGIPATDTGGIEFRDELQIYAGAGLVAGVSRCDRGDGCRCTRAVSLLQTQELAVTAFLRKT